MKSNPILRVDDPLGIDTSWRTKPGTALVIEDMRYDNRGGWRSVGGHAKLKSSGEVGGGGDWSSVNTVWSIAWFARHNGAERYLVYEYQVDGSSVLSLAWYNPQSGESVLIEPNRKLIDGAWQGTSYLANRGWLYFLNGHDAPQRWNGNYRMRVGFARRAAPPFVIDESTDLPHDEGFWDMGVKYPPTAASALNYKWEAYQKGVGAYPDTVDERWVYGYCVTWVNDLGMESEPSEIVWATGTNRKTTYGRKSVVIKVSTAPYNVVAVRIYRTHDVAKSLTASENRFDVYLHSERLTGHEMLIADDLTDDELGPPLDPDKLGAFPSGAKYLAMFKGTMFVAGMPDAPDRLRFSAPLFIEQFPGKNFFDVGSDSGGFRGLHSTKNALLVFKERGVYLVRGDPTNGFSLDTLTEDIGCSSPKSVVEVPGAGVLFVGSDGVYLVEGALENSGTPTRVVDISAPLRGLWEERISAQHLLSSCSVVYHRERCVWIQVPADGSWRPSLGLVFHYDVGRWSTRESWPIQCMVESRDEYGWLWFGSWDANHRGVHIYSPGYVDKDGTAIASKYRTSWMDFGSVWDRADVLYVQPYGWDYGGTRQIAFAGYADRAVTAGHTDSRDMSDHEAVKPVWGTAVWGTAVWGDYSPTPIRFDVSDSRGSLGLNTREFSFEVSGSRITLMGYDVEVAPRGGATSIIQLSNVISPDKR